ncbi:hypothetical protein F4820DRAFT_418243 [Hypoxylon rubiginosum]|uniref:Uncharacterized protein n=1 Tax=Hypoxylon rubiginosum TaxID=110542 RepID=A0ACB9Z399_9PEZI|nr:hypothetical protein F4820DRAFT_418243 [Hypoxylon rubiginosum]
MVDFNPEWIRGDDAETTVFAQAYGLGHTVIFSFTIDRSNLPTSLANRICTCMHGLEVNDESHSFPDQKAMRDALWEAVGKAWPDCLQAKQLKDPGVVFAIDCNVNASQLTCNTYHHSQYQLLFILLVLP